MQSIANFIGYQIVWFIAVIYAAHGTAVPGVAAAIVFVTWQLLASKCPRADAQLLLVALIMGSLIDGVLANTGWAQYAAATTAFPTPLWILALWASFSMTLNRSLAYLRGRPWLAAVFGAAGAPLAYLGAQRGWSAVVFQAPPWRGLVWLSCGWGVAMLTLAILAGRLPRR